jgi:hypothetical protein
MNSADFELFKMIGDLQNQFVFPEKLVSLKGLPFVECYLCKSRDHLAHNCEQCHFVVNKRKIIHEYNNFDINIRSKFERTDYKTPNPKTILEELKEGFDDIWDWDDDIKRCALELRKSYGDFQDEEEKK